MAGVLVIGEASGGGLLPASLEAAAAGASLAQALDEPLLGALIGDAANDAAATFASGFATLYLAEHVALQRYTAHAWVRAAQTVIAACNPTVVLCPHTLRARAWAPALAAALDTGLVLDCIALVIEGAQLVVHKPVHGGGVLGEFVVHGAPRMATLRGGAYARAAAAANHKVERLPIAIGENDHVVLMEEIAAPVGNGPKLTDAKIVVSGGRGLGSADNWHYIDDAAAALGAATGCSRPVADSGWVKSTHQVGLSGSSINADLYITVGISGAVQHLAGINSSAVVAAINTDAQADIFTRADYGVVGDYREVLPGFIEQVKKLKG
jgi:electron transfer flavoprotein alpha subunit